MLNLYRYSLAVILLCACIPQPAPVVPVEGARCSDACANLQRLGCTGAGGNDHATCDQACADLMAEGFVPLHLECVAGAHTCTQVDACAGEP